MGLPAVLFIGLATILGVRCILRSDGGIVRTVIAYLVGASVGSGLTMALASAIHYQPGFIASGLCATLAGVGIALWMFLMADKVSSDDTEDWKWG